MRFSTPTLHCDGEDCDNWGVDYYGCDAYSVDGVRITLQQRAPGWKSSSRDDLCPDCVRLVRLSLLNGGE